MGAESRFRIHDARKVSGWGWSVCAGANPSLCLTQRDPVVPMALDGEKSGPVFSRGKSGG